MAMAAAAAVAWTSRQLRCHCRHGIGRSGRGGRARCRLAASAGTAAAEAPPRPPKEEPTPFPPDEMFPWQVTQVLDILDEERPRKDELIDALQELQDLHEYDRQWAIWPQRLAEVRGSPYRRGLFLLLRGILRCVEKASGSVRAVAVDLLYSLIVGGCRLTRVPPTFVVEAGAVGALCRAAYETSDRTVFQVLTEVSRHVPVEMLPALINNGAIEAALDAIQEDAAAPLEQLAALDLVLSLSKRAPAKAVQAGAFEAVKAVSNEALVPRRNKIMNLLRPIVENPSGKSPGTNIRIGGLKF